MARIAIIHPEGNFNNNPNLSGILKRLAESGYALDIYATKHSNIDQSSPHPSIQVYRQEPVHAFQYDSAVLLPSIAHMSPFESAKIVIQQMPKPDLIIGVDRGIIEAQAIADSFGIPYGLISYEIFFADEVGRQLKLPEILACSGLKFAVCQDKVRSRELCRENEIKPEKLIHIPVASAGIVDRSKQFTIHDKLGIPREKKLLLYMGEINCLWTGIFDILEQSANWPASWNLILHHRYGVISTEVQQIIDRTNRGNVFVSPFSSLPMDTLPDLLNCVDAGVAFYIPQNTDPYSNKNLKFIGLASGKISTYLQHGVPVITNKIGEISDLLTSHNAGLAVNDGAHLATALNNFVVGDQIGNNCHKLFAEVLDLNKNIVSFLDKVSELTQIPTK